jgi:hypothetical protein
MIPTMCATGTGRARQAAEQPMDRQAEDLALEVVQCDVDRALGVGMAAHDLFHPSVDLRQVEGVDVDQTRAEHVADHVADRPRRLPEVAPRVAAPAAQRRRLAPADGAVIGLDADQRPLAERLVQAAPAEVPARRRAMSKTSSVRIRVPAAPPRRRGRE